ncbi:peptide deformylase [Pleomorphomonas diazotrophica]|uniref:Peptide deformylase-like n=1 Tax=Pleomorphomonas diazotrophica TaxID=1166257 RepID=A0A1I4RVM5_9HYPH|nr:peptide deformylase [Pleomorphomonas diazotrophica]PKR88018.1 peptide deformylase [Pleomorphomonas diazotrophica]SFM56317.1 peptide deformylase [Pleomorphomonas diazotrophica]
MKPPSLLAYPDPRLRMVAEPVMDFDDGLAALAAALVAAVEGAPAIGLAAPHLGVLRRVVAARSSTDASIRVYVNPKVEWVSAETMVNEEGSVSMPGVSAEVERPRMVRVAYFNLDGLEGAEEAEGFHAAVLQHEIDQLDGIFWIDRLSRLKRERLIKRYQKLAGRSVSSAILSP